MFEYIKGILQYKSSEYCVIDVGGVGFKINISLSTAGKLGDVGKQAMLYTYMSVKEDDISLFGFSTREELSMYLMVISVSGVGPKVGISIVATLDPSTFSLAVATGDYKKISQTKGVGPKLAQRIVLELKDKVTKEMKSNDAKVLASEDSEIATATGYISSDAISALMVLGYSSTEAAKIVRRVYEDGMTLEETVKKALKSAF
ncbi:MAG: Holliday junction branch migration protein RuvA [Ruminococcaceae bacterium]|nr:Holliday junction branch migration protein RuvA [Oscillospiraceae bacterium]